MAGIIYPDFARSIGGAMALRQNEQQNAFQMERARRQDQIEAEDREAGSHFGAALQGDPTAIAKVSANPKFALPLATHLQRLSADQRAKLKEQFEVTGKTAAGILALPEAEQPAAYEAAFQNLTAQGYKINLPPKWSPALKNQLQGYAIQVPEYLKMLGDRPAPMGGAPGSFTAQVSTDESGGNYNIPNAKGSGAYGKYQFMPETWASVAQANPQLNLPMNMRQATPQQQEAAMEAFTRSNGQALQQAGVPPTSANLYLAHRFGVGGATKFLSAPDDAPIATLFPPIWIQQNPDLNTTVGQFKRSVQSRYGGIPAGREVATGGNAAPMPEPPGIAQGDTQPRADASGTPTPPVGASPDVMGIKSWLAKAIPGARPMGQNGKPIYDKQGLLMIQMPNGETDWVEVPKAKDQKGGGPFGGTSVEAQALNMLVANGTLNPQQAAELAAGKTITNPADGSVIFMTPSGLFGQKPGQAPQPVGTPGASPAASSAAGAAPSATPPGMIPVTPPKPVQMTEGQANAGLYADRMREADAIIAKNEKAGLSLVDKAAAGIPVAGNKLVSEEYQLYDQARRNFVNAVLRRESGAVISTEEFANADKQYFPQPGDSDAVLKQKAENRRSAIEGISRAAGPTYKPTANQPAQSQAAPAPPKAGEVVDGYVFRGGNPADQSNWSKVQ